MSTSILKDMADPQMFGPHFKGPSWNGWKAFLAALFALPLNADSAELYRACTGRAEAPRAAFTEAALIVGRRGGKSRVLALIATWLAVSRDYAPHLAPGEVATIAVIAANRSQARSIFRYISGLLAAVPLLQTMVEDETGEGITLSNRVVIEISTASFRTTRGYSFAAVLADEIAFWRSDETSANPDQEILRALRPGMASIPGSVLLLASSPYAKRGSLYQAYRTHYGKDDARVLVWKAPTATMNPKIDPAIIAEAIEEDPEAAKAEYLAEFRDDLADFVTREIIDAVTCWGRRELSPVSGVPYAAFCDPSGGASDAMTLAVGHLDGSMCVLDAVLEIRAPFDPEKAVLECVELLRRYGVTRVIGDRYAGEWPKARFAEHGVTFEQSAKPKSDLYHNLLPLLNAGRVELLENPRLSAQLVGLERRTSRSGRDSIDHTPGGHDDLANAVAGVLVGIDLDRRPGLVRQSDVLVNNAGLPVPKYCRRLFCMIAVGIDGMSAILWAARAYEGGLIILDFDARPMRGTIFSDAADGCRDWAAKCPPTDGPPQGYAALALVSQARRAGVLLQPLPQAMVDQPENLFMSAAVHASAKRVRLCAPAVERAKTSPLGGALDFKPGDKTLDPLRLAALWAIACALDT